MSKARTLDGFFLPPAIRPAGFFKLEFGSLNIRLPKPNPTTVSDLINRLLAAQEASLSRRPIESILAVIDEASARWLKPDDPLRRLAEEALPEITGLSPPMIRWGLTQMMEGFQKEALRRIMNEGLGDLRRLDAFGPSKADPSRLLRAIGPRLSSHILSGNIPGLGAMELITTLLTKSACLCKVSSDEPLMTALFARSLAEIDPELGHALAVLGWKGGSPEGREIEEVVFGRSELVTAAGSDEAVSEIRLRAARHQSPSGRFIGYGHRMSLGLIGREALAAPEGFRAAVRAAALDVARHDQQGCLSPHFFYVETDAAQHPRRFARALGDELARLEKDLPRGRVDTRTSARLHRERSLARIREADGEKVSVFASPTGTLWTVIYEEDPTPVLSPLYRTVRVKPARDLMEVLPLLEPLRPFLQAAGISVSEDRRETLAEALARAGVARVCPIGRLQAPPAGWSQDGRRFPADRVRWVDLEL